ncbi:MAG TPA: nucleoside-diphosphate kinase [Methanomicrobia archaeon]|nr:nucleoside-diphosphate kinase [Methanomicrobia archaeon]
MSEVVIGEGLSDREVAAPKKERTFVMIKPGCVERGLIGAVIERFERAGLTIAAVKLVQLTRQVAETQYAEHEGEYYYEGLITYMISGPTIAVVLEGDDAINVARETAGKTDPREAEFGTIRADFGTDTRHNVVHAADSEAAAKREIEIHFPELS